jgi:hypothetical protein
VLGTLARSAAVHWIFLKEAQAATRNIAGEQRDATLQGRLNAKPLRQRVVPYKNDAANVPGTLAAFTVYIRPKELFLVPAARRVDLQIAGGDDRRVILAVSYL